MIPNRPLKVIIDTNIWISLIISKKVNEQELLLYSKEIRLLFSEELIQEISQTIKKPKLSKYFQSAGIEDMFDAFDPFIDMIEVSSQVSICRDSNDDFLLNLAIDGNANYLLTGDLDILSLKKIGNTQVVKISDFLK
jgi:hypothetical protein